MVEIRGPWGSGWGSSGAGGPELCYGLKHGNCDKTDGKQNHIKHIFDMDTRKEGRIGGWAQRRNGEKILVELVLVRRPLVVVGKK